MEEVLYTTKDILIDPRANDMALTLGFTKERTFEMSHLIADVLSNIGDASLEDGEGRLFLIKAVLDAAGEMTVREAIFLFHMTDVLVAEMTKVIEIK